MEQVRSNENPTVTRQETAPGCVFCGAAGDHRPESCLAVRAVEYHADGRIARVETHARGVERSGSLEELVALVDQNCAR